MRLFYLNRKSDIYYVEFINQLLLNHQIRYHYQKYLELFLHLRNPLYLFPVIELRGDINSTEPNKETMKKFIALQSKDSIGGYYGV